MGVGLTRRWLVADDHPDCLSSVCVTATSPPAGWLAAVRGADPPDLLCDDQPGHGEPREDDVGMIVGVARRIVHPGVDGQDAVAEYQTS